MKLLFDECITIHFPHSTKYFLRMPKFESVMDILGAGTKDDKIQEYAEKKNMIIATQDKQFIKKILETKKPIVCVFSNGSMIKMEKIGQLKEPDRELTRYAFENETIVIP